MEENRLKPMPVGYDPEMFNRLYSKTEGLRRSLAAQINYHRFGLDYDEILSWFTVKFIFVFTKYHNKKEDHLLGDIINSLKNFKNRIIRHAYLPKFSQKIIRYGDTNEIEDVKVFSPEYDSETREKLEWVKKFMKTHLSDNAYVLFEIQIQPPMYILHKLNTKEIPSIHKIPDELLCEYLGITYNNKAIKYISSLKKEIRNAISSAQYHFSS